MVPLPDRSSFYLPICRDIAWTVHHLVSRGASTITCSVAYAGWDCTVLLEAFERQQPVINRALSWYTQDQQFGLRIPRLVDTRALRSQDVTSRPFLVMINPNYWAILQSRHLFSSIMARFSAGSRSLL